MATGFSLLPDAPRPEACSIAIPRHLPPWRLTLPSVSARLPLQVQYEFGWGWARGQDGKTQRTWQGGGLLEERVPLGPSAPLPPGQTGGEAALYTRLLWSVSKTSKSPE